MERFSVTCPHCRALLEVDGEKGVVVDCVVPESPRSATSLEDRLRTLTREREEAHAKMAEAMRAESAGPEVREEKFKKLLESARSEPVEKPIRDMDLD